MRTDVTLKEFRDFTPLRPLLRGPFCIFLCRVFSPLVSIPCIRKGIHPNTVTLLMIISGFLGGILFLLPSVLYKLFACVCYFLWFIFDCSDGEVARFTQTFSKYGKQLDWIAHMVCHPLLILGVFISFVQNDVGNIFHLSVVSILLVSLELIGRNKISWDFFIFNNNPYSGTTISSRMSFGFSYISTQLLYFPNFVLFYPPILIICIGLSSAIIGLYIYYIWALLYIFANVISLIKLIAFMYKE